MLAGISIAVADTPFKIPQKSSETWTGVVLRARRSIFGSVRAILRASSHAYHRSDKTCLMARWVRRTYCLISASLKALQV